MNRKPASIISLIATITTMVIGILVIIGWFTYNDFLRSIVPGAVKMKVNVALGFIFSSIVLLLFLFPQKNKIWRSVYTVLSVTVSLIGLLTLIEYIFHINLGIDELFFRDELRTTATYYAGRMSPISAVNFILIGLGLLFLNKEKAAVFQFFYLVPIALIALLMLICFNFISDIPTFIRLAIHVAFGFITLSAAIYFAQPVIQKKINFQTKLITGFIAAITLLAIISIFSSYYDARRIYSNNRVDNTNKVLDEAGQVLSLVKDIESGGPAYVITGDSSYLDYFIVAKAAVFNHVKNLKGLTANNVLQQRRIDSLQALIDKRIDFSEESIRIRKEKGLNAAINWIANLSGKYYTDRIRYFTEEIQKEERNLLVQREKGNEKSIAAFNKAFSTLLVTMTCLLGFIFFVISYNFKKRIKAEKQSKENEEQVETIFRAAPDGVVAINSDGTILRWNTKAEILFGWTADEVIGKPLAEIIIPHRYREAHKTGMKNFLDTGDGPVLGATIEIQGLRKDNTELDIALSISPTIVKNKFLFIGFIHDITDKKKAEEEIRGLNVSLEQRVIERTEELNESEKKYRYLFENNPMPMWIIDLYTFQFLNVNDAAVTHYGYSRDEFLSMTALDIRPEGEKQRFAQLQRSPYSVVRNRGNWKHIKKNGSIIDVEIIAHEIFYEGRAARFILSNDITEKVKAEEKLSEEKNLLRTLIDILPDYIYFKDTQSRHLVNNRANIRLIGASNEEETIGKSVIDFFGPQVAKSLIEDDQLIIKTGATVVNMEEMIELSTGKNKYLLTTKVPVKDKNGKVTGLVGISRDITKQKEVELELRESKYFLEKAQKVGQIGHWISNRQEGKLTWSEEACRIFGLNYNDFDGRIETFLNRVHPDDLEKVNSATALAIENNQPYSIDHRIILSNGTIKWVNEQGETIFGETGKAIMLMGIVQDITERKLVEEDLKNSLKEISDYKYALDESSIVAITDQKGIIKYVNDNFCTISKYSADKLLRQNLLIINSGHHSKEFIHDLWVTISNGKIWKGEIENKARDGTIYWIDTTIVPFLNSEGKPYQYIAIATDITERKQAEQDLSESQELLRAIIDNSTAIIYVKNLKGQYLLVNRRFSELFHVNLPEVLGKTDYDFFPKDMADAFRSMDERVAAAGHPLTEQEIARLDDGLHTYISVKSTLKDSKGKTYATFGISTDITEQKVVEESLRKSFKEISDYKYALDESSIVAITTQKGIITYANDNFCKISKYTKEELIGQDHRIINSGYHSKKFIRDLWVTIANGKIWRGELKNKAKDGSIYWVDTTIVPFLDNEGKPYQYIAIRADITQRKIAEEIQKELEERVQMQTAELTGIFERITEGFIVLDKNFCYTYVNKKIGEMTGRDPKSLIGKHVWDEFPEAIGSSTYHSFNRAMAEQQYVNNIDYYAPLDFWQENFIYPSPEGLSVFIKDITAEKRAEEKIKQSEKIYKTIASHIPGSLICLFNPDHRYLLIEGDMAEKLGYSKESFLGKKAGDVLSPERYALFLPDLVRVFEGEIFTTEAISGGYDIVTRFVPLKNENNIVYAAMTVAIDVTQLQNAQRKIFELNIGLEKKVIDRTVQLEEVNKELEAFTYSVSHDLRAPLRIIDGFAGILVADFADKLNDEGNRTLGVIMNNARRMGQLIDDLLNLSRLGRQDIRLNKINMDRMIKSVVDEQLQLFNKQINVTYEQLLPAECDNGLIRQVWVNLISNAIKYSGRQAHPQITIGSYHKENDIIYFVKDNGVGFDMKYAGKLFGVFQRLHKITEFEGTGVGLALVQRIIVKHGGKVWAQAEINKGATFYFSLPVA